MSSLPSNDAVRVADVNLFTPMLFAFMAASVLYGANLVQVGVFFGQKNVFRRQRALTIWVTSLFLMDTAEYAAEAYFAWFLFVRNVTTNTPETPGTIVVTAWFWKAEFLSYSCTFAAQMFFVRKILLLTESRVLAASLSVLSLGGLASGIVIIIATTRGGSASDIVSTIGKSTIAEKVCNTLCETLISVFMVRCLRVRGKAFKDLESGVEEVTEATDGSSSILKRLTVFILSRGIILLLAQVVSTGLYYGMPKTYWYFILRMSLGKPATASVLTSLNVRGFILNGRAGSAPGVKTPVLDDIRFASPSFQRTTVGGGGSYNQTYARGLQSWPATDSDTSGPESSLKHMENKSE